MVTRLHSGYFEALRTSISTLHSTCHTVRTQPPAQGKDIQVMGRNGKDMTSTKVVMVGRKCSPICRFQDMGRHLQMHGECLQDCRKTIQSIGQHLSALVLHLNLILANLGDPRLGSQRKGSSSLRNRGKQMLYGLQSCLHCWICPTTIMMQMMRATIRRTWAVRKANCQSAWSKQNSP